MNPEAIIRRHLDLCDQVYTVLNEENRILRGTGQVPEAAFLERKRALLPQLTESVDELKQLRASEPHLGPILKDLVESAQKKLMKIFLLDRENEQLLLKASMPRTTQRPKLPGFGSTGIYESIRDHIPAEGGLNEQA
ncbi:MAG: hypothetical protein JW739_04970 [Opitutales bacterium]|nr:hypothetical protein [Opitutales bacterium]